MATALDQPVRLARAILRIGALAVAGWTVLALGCLLAALALLPLAAAAPVCAVLAAAAIAPVWRFHRIVPPASSTIPVEGGTQSELHLIVRQISSALGVPTPARWSSRRTATPGSSRGPAARCW